MTEYWVIQGNKWRDTCKIYISNNPLSIRTHELGQRHKDIVTKRLANMRKENAAKEKEQKEAARALEQIEAKVKRSYQKDLAAQQYSESTSYTQEPYAPYSVSRDGWEYDTTSGYHFNSSISYYYDTMSGLYYSDTVGKWATQQEAFLGYLPTSGSQKEEPIPKKVEVDTCLSNYEKGTPPGLVVTGPVNPKRVVKGAPSLIAVNKRKRQDRKPKVVSKEEEATLRAREAANKRMEEREINARALQVILVTEGCFKRLSTHALRFHHLQQMFRWCGFSVMSCGRPSFCLL